MSDDFLRLQFQTLREEILATQRRDFQVIGIGLLVVPTLNHFKLPWAAPLILALPAIAIVIVLIHMAHEQSVLRCAAYIRECIEPVLGSLSRQLNHPAGWETWLVRLDGVEGKRTADWYMRVGVNILLMSYLSITLWVAGAYVAYEAEWKVLGSALLVAYGGIAAALVRKIYFATMERLALTAVNEPQTATETALANHIDARLQIKVQESTSPDSRPPDPVRAEIVMPSKPGA